MQVRARGGGAPTLQALGQDKPCGVSTEEAEFEDVMEAVIERGLEDFEAGNYVVGIEVARAEVARRVSARG